MKKFVYRAERMPSQFDTWFPGFHHGGVIEANSWLEAQMKLNTLCREYGSDMDSQWVANGPYAEEIEVVV